MHIAIAGNIGSGKTTLTHLLATPLNCQPEFEDPVSNPYIQDFYADMQRWAFNMQICFLDIRLRSTISIQESTTDILQDRTIYEDAEIFAPNLLEMGLLSQRDYDTYRSLYDSVVTLIQPPDLVIYLRASIAALVEQIASRNRAYEDSIRMDYLKRLNERYEAWFEHYDHGQKMVISVDELNFRDDDAALSEIVNRVKAETSGLFSVK